jgi:hypothetical protein
MRGLKKIALLSGSAVLAVGLLGAGVLFTRSESKVRFNRPLCHEHRVVSVDGGGNNPLHGRGDANSVVVRLDRTDPVKV